LTRYTKPWWDGVPGTPVPDAHRHLELVFADVERHVGAYPGRLPSIAWPASPEQALTAMETIAHERLHCQEGGGAQHHRHGLVCRRQRLHVETVCRPGTYIKRMSNHCSGRRYRPNVRLGTDACPITLFYWDFGDQRERALAGNMRTALMAANLVGRWLAGGSLVARLSAAGRAAIRPGAAPARPRCPVTVFAWLSQGLRKLVPGRDAIPCGRTP
jgi:hypothetical protein